MDETEKSARVAKLVSLPEFKPWSTQLKFNLMQRFAKTSTGGVAGGCSLWEAMNPEGGQVVSLSAQQQAYAALGSSVGEAFYPAIEAAWEEAHTAEPPRNGAAEAWKVLKEKALGNTDA
jgi:hypothetical protein